MRNCFAFFLLLLSVFGFANTCFCREPKTWVLFDQYGIVSGYSLDIQNIKAGDFIAFSNGRKFKVKYSLGSGSNTKIFMLEDGKAIRVPLEVFNRYSGERNTNFIQKFFDGYKVLAQSKVPIVKMYELECLVPEYVVIDAVNVKFTLADILSNRWPLGFSEGEKTRVWNKLVEFASSTYEFTYIGDFPGGSQVAWTGDHWVLIDWTDDFSFANGIEGRNGPTVFRNISLPDNVNASIENVIYSKRLKDPPDLGSRIKMVQSKVHSPPHPEHLRTNGSSSCVHAIMQLLNLR